MWHGKKPIDRCNKQKNEGLLLGILVTVGICARNSEQFIAEAVESVLSQDFPHELVEIIFVDDGSEDRTLEIINSCISKTDITTRIFSGPWRGLGKARNTVINHAKGEFIVWVDSDEVIERQFLRKQINIINSNPQAGIATARVWFNRTENLILILDLIPPIVEYSIQDWRKKLPGTGGTTFRVAAMKQVGGFNENINGAGEDIDLCKRIRQAGWTIIGGNGFYYEKHGQLSTFKHLMIKYIYHGCQARLLESQVGPIISIYKINPLASLIIGIFYGAFGYKVTKLKISLITPIHYTLKMTAWFYGFSFAKRDPA